MKDLFKKRGVVTDNYFTVWFPKNAEGIAQANSQIEI